MHRSLPFATLCALLVWPIAGCARGPALEAYTLKHDGEDRRWLLFEPSAELPRPAPLVIALHGGGGVAEKLDGTTNGQIAREARARGWRVVYPVGLDKGWNDGRAPVTANDRRLVKADDVGFLDALIDDLIARELADPARIYVMGISNGGFMAQYLALKRAPRLAAAAAVTAQVIEAWADQAPTTPVPVLLMNGTKDPLIPYGGGQIVVLGRERGVVRSTEASAAWWARHARCPEPVTTSLPDTRPKDGTRVHTVRYTGCAGGAEVLLYRVEGGGHTWPGGKQYLPKGMIGPVSRDIKAVPHIFEFFARHRR